MSNSTKITSSVNNFIENKIKNNKIMKQTNNNINNFNNDCDDVNYNSIDTLHDEIEIEKLENELYIKSHSSKNYPKNYGNLWTNDERKIILNNLKKNIKFNNTSLYDDEIILKIAKKTERSEVGVKEEIKKMIFNDYIEELYSLSQLSTKYNITESNIKILIKLYLEKYGKKCLYPIELENQILKCRIENIKLKNELKELMTNNNN
jgi:hypothetical protein